MGRNCVKDTKEEKECNMCIYDLIMFVQLCTVLPICMAPLMLYCIL